VDARVVDHLFVRVYSLVGLGVRALAA
jgi:hypothetical protein